MSNSTLTSRGGAVLEVRESFFAPAAAPDHQRKLSNCFRKYFDVIIMNRIAQHHGKKQSLIFERAFSRGPLHPHHKAGASSHRVRFDLRLTGRTIAMDGGPLPSLLSGMAAPRSLEVEFELTFHDMFLSVPSRRRRARGRVARYVHKHYRGCQTELK